jgi:enamine deaminase RidA (YjgF/YER057c/UK114 family)
VQALRSGDAIFIGGQPAFGPSREILHPDDMEAQTRLVMDRIVALLARFGAGIDDVMKVGCWYNGAASVATLRRNASIRSSYYRRPGPTSTGVPLPRQYAAGMEIQVDIVAMAPRRRG